MVYQTEKQLKDLGDKVPADVKSKVESKITSLKEAAAGDNTEATKKAIEDLQKEVRLGSWAFLRYSQSSHFLCACLAACCTSQLRHFGLANSAATACFQLLPSLSKGGLDSLEHGITLCMHANNRSLCIKPT